MAYSYLLSLAVLVELALLEHALCQGSVEVVVTTPASLQEQIRSQIDSALSSFTCDTNSSPPPPDNNDTPNKAEMATEMVINKLNAISDKLDTLQQRLEMLHQLGSSPVHPASSCAEILQEYPNSMSGHYWVSNATGHAHSVYCDMTRSCGGVTGGWMRVAYLDMTNSSHQCPSSLHQRTDSGVRSCAVKYNHGSCSSVYYATQGIHYSKVCGKMRGYQVRTPDGFNNNNNIDSIYVDGVSLTHGKSERHHIWTFAVFHTCPCKTSPAFVGTNYFCDGGPYYPSINLANPVWDGQGCGSNTCCSTFNNPPWFYRQLPQTTIDDVEMRLCRNQDRDDEDTTVDVVEIYVQ